jgi:hypothetical protein
MPRLRSLRGIVAAAGLFVPISACSDSTGPGNVDSNAALQSLALGMGPFFVITSPTGSPVDASFGGIAPLLDQVDVTIDGRSHTMFALGLRETFPDGTCEEDLFIFPGFPPEPGVCTPPPAELAVIMWQSHSASAPPDRLVFMVADVGTSDFSVGFLSEPTSTIAVPAFALYLEGEDSFWLSRSGTLTSQVAVTSQSCSLPLPPYAKSGTCSVATFDEQGAITFEELTETGPGTYSRHEGEARQRNLTIPRQTIHGLWQVITETQPFTFPEYQRISRWLGVSSEFRGSSRRSREP